MSKIEKINIRCPHCGTSGEHTYYGSLNVTLHPELKEDLMSRKLFEWKCPNCGETIIVATPVLYHDMNNHFMIHFSWRENDGDFENVMNSGGFKLPGYTYRSVYSLLDLREKSLILERGYNDGVIELIKAMILLEIIPVELENLSLSGEIHVMSILEKGILFKYECKSHDSQMFIYSREGYEFALEELGKIATVKNGQCVDLKWALSILQKKR